MCDNRQTHSLTMDIKKHQIKLRKKVVNINDISIHGTRAGIYYYMIREMMMMNEREELNIGQRKTSPAYYTEQPVLSTRHMLSRFMPYFANCSLT